jgi:hypothetical protein
VRPAAESGHRAGEVVVTPEETPTCTFVVRMWREEPTTASTPAIWRGSVTNVLDRDTVSFSELDQVVAFIRATLAAVDRRREAQSRGLPWTDS